MAQKQKQLDLETARFIRAFADDFAAGKPITIDLAQQLCSVVRTQGPRIAMALEKCAGHEK